MYCCAAVLLYCTAVFCATVMLNCCITTLLYCTRMYCITVLGTFSMTPASTTSHLVSLDTPPASLIQGTGAGRAGPPPPPADFIHEQILHNSFIRSLKVIPTVKLNLPFISMKYFPLTTCVLYSSYLIPFHKSRSGFHYLLSC